MGKREKDFIKDALAEAQKAINSTRRRAKRMALPQEMPQQPRMGMHEAAAQATGQQAGFSGPGTGDPDLDWIIGKESSGRTTAKNPKSSAFGLGQLIKANREAYGKRLGFSPDTTDYNEQLQMMREYIKERYGTVKDARKFWESKGWY